MLVKAIKSRVTTTARDRSTLQGIRLRCAASSTDDRIPVVLEQHHAADAKMDTEREYCALISMYVPFERLPDILILLTDPRDVPVVSGVQASSEEPHGRILHAHKSPGRVRTPVYGVTV